MCFLSFYFAGPVAVSSVPWIWEVSVVVLVEARLNNLLSLFLKLSLAVSSLLVIFLRVISRFKQCGRLGRARSFVDNLFSSQ